MVEESIAFANAGEYGVRIDVSTQGFGVDGEPGVGFRFPRLHGEVRAVERTEGLETAIVDGTATFEHLTVVE
jgi:hypothetical protein